jgi:hypothetical protein
MLWSPAACVWRAAMWSTSRPGRGGPRELAVRPLGRPEDAGGGAERAARCCCRRGPGTHPSSRYASWRRPARCGSSSESEMVRMM